MYSIKQLHSVAISTVFFQLFLVSHTDFPGHQMTQLVGVGLFPLLAGPAGGIVNRGNSLTSCLFSIVQTDQIVTVEAEYVMSVRLDC